MTREHETSLSYLHSLVSDVFNLLEVGLLIRIEHQLLEVHSSQPALNPQPRPCTFASAFPDACRCWTGGCPCPRGQGIKSMPMRSSARQRKRSSRRPCRPHKSSCRGRRPWIVRPRRTRRSPQCPMRRRERRRSRRPLRARRHASTSPLQTTRRARRRGQVEHRRSWPRCHTHHHHRHHHHLHHGSSISVQHRPIQVARVFFFCLACSMQGSCALLRLVFRFFYLVLFFWHIYNNF